jgi:4-hydroxybenzoate polyprenyltransferase
MIRFSHTVFALPFAALATVMAFVAPASGAIEFRWWWIVGILVAMVGARSAAMAFNRLVDRRIDAENPRTAKRHLPAGILSVSMVTGFTLISILIFLGGTILFWPNWLPVAVAIPVLLVLLGYSYAKRFTALAHVWLGFALGLAPVCVWLAVRGGEVLRDPFDLFPSVLVGMAVMCWVSGFDIIYACQDADFDRQSGLRSIPAWLGVPQALGVAAVFHFVTILLFCAVPFSHWVGGPELGLGAIWLVGLLAIAGLLVWEHRLVSPNDLSRVNAAFFNVNAVISLGLLLIGTVDLIM